MPLLDLFVGFLVLLGADRGYGRASEPHNLRLLRHNNKSFLRRGGREFDGGSNSRDTQCLTAPVAGPDR